MTSNENMARDVTLMKVKKSGREEQTAKEVSATSKKQCQSKKKNCLIFQVSLYFPILNIPNILPEK